MADAEAVEARAIQERADAQMAAALAREYENAPISAVSGGSCGGRSFGLFGQEGHAECCGGRFIGSECGRD